MAFVMRFAADNVHQAVIPDSGHWLMEEQPDATVAAIKAFLQETTSASLGQVRMTADEVAALPRDTAGAGTSKLKGVEMVVLSGNPAEAGTYAIQLKVPANTKIASHTHHDNRTALVISGEWYFGYGPKANETDARRLGAGSYYTEPANADHFAFTKDKPAVIFITGQGPSDTRYVDAAEEQSANQ